jgi:SAM-dependent methyltransferase
MGTLNCLSHVMQYPTVYQLWQAPFVQAKFAPVARHNDLSTVRRVLDVGCGPGTNAPLFSRMDYLGLDLNPWYIDRARRRFQRPFVVADVCTYRAPEDARFDFILVNSLLHHLDDDNMSRVLRQLLGQHTSDGHIHILELVLPAQASIPRWLARADRGDHPRSLERWRTMFCEVFQEVIFEPYPVGCFGVALWKMVYFKGRARS